MTTDPRARVFLRVLVIATVSLAAISGCVPRQTERPREVTKKYLTYLVKRNYEKAYPLLVAGFRKEHPVGDLMSTNEQLVGQGMRFDAPWVSRERRSGDTATVEYGLWVSGGPMGGARRKFTSTAGLRYESGGWRINRIMGLPRKWLEKQLEK